MKSLYLDDASSTRVHSLTVREMGKFFSEQYGNPSSVHVFGEHARKAIDNVRKELSAEIKCKPWEIIFTSGVTEANNLAFLGLTRRAENRNKKKIIVSSVEHASIMEICSVLAKHGYKIVRVPVSSEGIVDYKFLEKEIDAQTLIVSVMHANNVLGTIQDIARIGELCKRKNVPFHTDASQSFGKLAIDVKSANLSLLSASAHKIGGPKGVGFLYVKENVKLEPIIYGGGQERGLRGGTENVPGIAGLGKALELMKKTNKKAIESVRDYFMQELESIGGKINGSRTHRIYNNIHASFDTNASNLVAYLSHKGIYVSTGSACESKSDKEDHVLRAIGLSKKAVDGSIRITLNDKISRADVLRVVKEIKSYLKLKA